MTSGRDFLSINFHNASGVSEVGQAVPGEPGAGRGKRQAGRRRVLVAAVVRRRSPLLWVQSDRGARGSAGRLALPTPTITRFSFDHENAPGGRVPPRKMTPRPHPPPEILKGFHHSARGCAERATLGQASNKDSTPTGLNHLNALTRIVENGFRCRPRPRRGEIIMNRRRVRARGLHHPESRFPFHVSRFPSPEPRVPTHVSRSDEDRSCPYRTTVSWLDCAAARMLNRRGG